MEYVADTVAIIRHFSRLGKIGSRAKTVLQAADRGENTVYVSVFSLAEILYLSEKNRIPISLHDVVGLMESLDNYQLVDLTPEIVIEAQNVPGLELHDRLIVATARTLGVPLITSDQSIQDSRSVEIVWA